MTLKSICTKHHKTTYSTKYRHVTYLSVYIRIRPIHKLFEGVANLKVLGNNNNKLKLH
jgi:hypothetical protein